MKQDAHVPAAGDFRWRLQPDFAQHLGPGGVRLEDWLRSGQAQIVKHGSQRVVYRVTLGQVTFYLKHNLTPDALTWCRQLLRPSKARREFERALDVGARGIATARPLAWAQERGLFNTGESFLATISVDDALPLHAYVAQTLPQLTPLEQVRFRQHLARVLGRFVARLHDAGICHHDLHVGNLLVRGSSADDLEIFLIDLNGVQVGPSLSRRRSLDNLVVLSHWFALHATRADRLRFWQSYLAARPGLFGTVLATRDRRAKLPARRLEQATWESLRQLWQRRDRRCLVDNREYRRLQAPHAIGHTATDLDPELAHALLTDPDAPFRQQDVGYLKNSATSTVIEMTGLVCGRPTALIYKRFCLKKRSTPWTSLVRMPPALRSWQQGQGFRERGLPTPRPLLVLHRRRHGMLFEGFLLTEKIEHALHLHDFLDRLATLSPGDRIRPLRDGLERVARAVRELHRRQISHRDLKANNIMLTSPSPVLPCSPAPARAYPETRSLGEREKGSQPLDGVWFIDLVGVQQCRHLSKQRRVQNLARLNASFHERPDVTRSDRLRFLRTYLQWGLIGKHGWKKWWRTIGSATDAKVSRNERLGRKVV